MASIQKTATGYRAQLQVLGQRESESFKTKREAQQWAARRDAELRAGAGSLGTRKTLLQTLRRYSNEVSSRRRGWRWEHLRLAAFERSPVLPVHVPVSRVQVQDIVLWREARLAQVSEGTVLREMALLSAVFEVARRDWRWISVNPVKDVAKPKRPAHRERRLAWTEMKQVLRALGHRAGQRGNDAPRSTNQAVALCLLAALRTGMRAGELTKLKWPQVRGTHVHLASGTTKSGKARDVPLSTKARAVFARAQGLDKVSVFGVSAAVLDTLFRRARGRAGLSGFTFHDARHTAATWIGLSNRLSMLEMCKMFGWGDPKHALIYFNPGVGDLAAKLG